MSSEPLQSAPAPDPQEMAATLAEQYEGYSATAYRDPVGVWTIGYGSTRDDAGNPITASTPPISQSTAIFWLMRDMRAAFDEIARDVTVPLTAQESAALDDFIYNVGAGNFRSSTLLRLLNAGNYAMAALEFPKWDLAGGKVLEGLVKRRAAEQALFRV